MLLLLLRLCRRLRMRHARRGDIRVARYAPRAQRVEVRALCARWLCHFILVSLFSAGQRVRACVKCSMPTRAEELQAQHIRVGSSSSVLLSSTPAECCH